MTTTTAFFTRDGIEYRAHGAMGGADAAQNGLIVKRLDGRPLAGAQMQPGMVQTGVSDSLRRAALAALRKANR